MALPVLPREGFDEHVRALRRVAVVFTADWCPHCRRFAPVAEEAAARHADLPFALADISDDEGDPRWDEYAIRVVPTVVLFVDGQPSARVDGVLGRGIQPRDLERFLRGQHGQATLGGAP